MCLWQELDLLRHLNRSLQPVVRSTVPGRGGGLTTHTHHPYTHSLPNSLTASMAPQPHAVEVQHHFI